MSFDDELDELIEWCWGDGIAAIDAKDEGYTEVCAHAEMFIVLGSVLNMRGWTRADLIEMLDDCVFADQPNRVLH
jgi:hypothetical protein